jgi:hypothetical protein
MDCTMLHYRCIVSAFSVNYESFHCGLYCLTGVWLGRGQGRQPGGKPPGAAALRRSVCPALGLGADQDDRRVATWCAWSAKPWVLGQTKSARGALAATPTRWPPKRRVVLDFLSLGCSPRATWRLGCLYFQYIVLKIFFLV